MNAERRKGVRPERKKEAVPNIKDFTLLQAFLEDSNEVAKEYELERRFLPARLLTNEELEELPMRVINQRFVNVKSEQGLLTFRLRMTHQSGDEGVMYRVARKVPSGGSFGKTESQLAFKPSEDADKAEEFEVLWNKKGASRMITRQRYYLEHALPNGSTCDIHYEVWKGGKEDGFVRIEVEFHSDEDQRYFEDHPNILPDWVGKDVTFHSAYRVKFITKDGLPKEAFDHMRRLRKK